jgi:hypothetical protein
MTEKKDSHRPIQNSPDGQFNPRFFEVPVQFRDNFRSHPIHITFSPPSGSERGAATSQTLGPDVVDAAALLTNNAE